MDGINAATASPRKEWLTPNEGAAYLKVKPNTLRYWARMGKVPAHRLSGTRRVIWRFLQSELDATLLPSSAVSAEGGQHCE